MVRRHEIQVLRRAGHSLVETAKLVGVSQAAFSASKLKQQSLV